MSYPLQLDGFEGQNLEVQSPGFFSGAKLLVNGQPAPKGKGRGEMLLRRDDGGEVIARWAPQFIDVPQIAVGGKKIQLVPPLSWYEWAWCALPIALIFVGGALGALIGVVGFWMNAKIFRTQLSRLVKYALAAGVIVLAVVAYGLAVTLFSIAFVR